MRDDVRRAALEAAAKLTVTMLALGGCTEPKPLPPITPDPTPVASASAPAPTVTAAPVISCETAIDETFPKPGDYPGTKKEVSPEVQRCCDALLAKGDHVNNPHRWDCCENRSPAGMKNNKLWAACTPWGPPVPPSVSNAFSPTFSGEAMV